MAFTVALRNLLSDKLRLFATLIGIAAAVVLIVGQSAIYAGASKTITAIIDESDADLWIMPKGTQSFEDGIPLLTDFDRHRALAVRGVSNVEPIVSAFAEWGEARGVTDTIVLVGLPPGPTHPSVSIISRDAGALIRSRDVVVDARDRDDLGVSGVGAHASIEEKTVRVTGLSKNVRSFTQSPYVFASPSQVRESLGVSSDASTYLMVKTDDAADITSVQRSLAQRLSYVDVLQPAEFKDRSLQTWLNDTGAGQSLIMGTLLGAIVGAAIMAQTINSNVRDHEREFALLRSMGCTTWYVQSIVLFEAMFLAIGGFILGMLIFLPVVPLTEPTPLFLYVSWRVIACVVVLVLFIAAVSALAAIQKVRRIDPVTLLK